MIRLHKYRTYAEPPQLKTWYGMISGTDKRARIKDIYNQRFENHGIFPYAQNAPRAYYAMRTYKEISVFMADYFLIRDLNMVARMEAGKSFVFDRSRGDWVADTANLVAQHMGTDGESEGRLTPLNEQEAQTEIGKREDRSDA